MQKRVIENSIQAVRKRMRLVFFRNFEPYNLCTWGLLYFSQPEDCLTVLPLRGWRLDCSATTTASMAGWSSAGWITAVAEDFDAKDFGRRGRWCVVAI